MDKGTPEVNPTAHPAGAPPQARFSLARLWPLAALALAIVAAIVLDLDRFLTFDALRQHREALTAFVADRTALAALTFVVVYAAAIALSVPGGAVLTIAGGFMFG